MNLDFTRLFKKPGAKPDVSIRTKRPMILPIEGTPQHVQAGTEVSIPYDDFRNLDAGDFELISSNQPQVDIPNPSPERPDRAPLPPQWDRLPGCFREWHELDQDFITARRHVDLILAKRREIFGTDLVIGDATGTILAGGIVHPKDTRDRGVYSTLKPLDLDDPKLRKLDRMLTIAEDAARDYFKRLIETKELTYQKLFLQCGHHRLAVADELRGILAELDATGRAIFETRIGALGLHQNHVAKLYHGGADYAKYSNHAPAIAGFVRSGGLDEQKQPRLYSDEPIASQAEWSLSMSERIKELAPVLKQAKAELSKAQKAVAVAA